MSREATSPPLFRTLIAIGLIGILPSLWAEPLPQHRLAGGFYVAVGQLAQACDLGRDHSQNSHTAEYRMGSADLSVEVDHRDIHLNGVIHWINSPVIMERGTLWIRADDVAKTILPVLRPHHAPGKPLVRTVILDPGHGGADTGARGLSGHVEKEWTLDTVKRIARHLEGHGLHVVWTRDSDRTVPLPDRPVFCAAQHGDLFVSVHFNSGGPTAEGIETYCTTPAGEASTANASGQHGNEEPVPSNRYDEQSVWLAHCVHERALHATNANDRGVRRARFEVIREENCPAILIEGGFLTNQSEEPKIMNPEYRERLATAIADGILAYVRSVGSPEGR